MQKIQKIKVYSLISNNNNESTSTQNNNNNKSNDQNNKKQGKKDPDLYPGKTFNQIFIQ